MSRLTMEYTPDSQASKTLDGIKQSIGMLPNVFKLMGHSSNVLDGYLAFSGALKKGTLSEQEREQIALAVAGFDQCQYCASAHTLFATKAGITAEEAKNNLHGSSQNPKISSLINFCLKILKTKGFVDEADFKSIRAAGFSDTAIVEIVANVCINIFTNYFNHVAGTEVDFPKVSLE